MSTPKTPRIGLALGGGGAKGLAHIPLLETLDTLGVRPHMIAGTSIGAIFGTLYAAGIPGRDIAEVIDDLVALPRSLQEVFEAKRLFAWLDYLNLEVGRNSLLQVDRFLDRIEDVIGVTTFEELKTPLKIVAADFWAREEAVFDSGPIIPALAASFALPGVFKPVIMGDRVLVDGGSVNPLPYDLLHPDCDVAVAIDVIGQRAPTDQLMPTYVEAVFNTFQIAEKSILKAKFEAQPPDIYIEVPIAGIRVLEFHKAEQIYAQAMPACEELARRLKDVAG